MTWGRFNLSQQAQSHPFLAHHIPQMNKWLAWWTQTIWSMRIRLWMSSAPSSGEGQAHHSCSVCTASCRREWITNILKCIEKPCLDRKSKCLPYLMQLVCCTIPRKAEVQIKYSIESAFYMRIMRVSPLDYTCALHPCLELQSVEESQWVWRALEETLLLHLRWETAQVDN